MYYHVCTEYIQHSYYYNHYQPVIGFILSTPKLIELGLALSVTDSQYRVHFYAAGYALRHPFIGHRPGRGSYVTPHFIRIQHPSC